MINSARRQTMFNIVNRNSELVLMCQPNVVPKLFQVNIKTLKRCRSSILIYLNHSQMVHLMNITKYFREDFL